MSIDHKQAPADPCAWLNDAVEKSARWMNLWFLQDGESCLGDTVYPTADAALSAWEEQTEYLRADKIAILLKKKSIWVAANAGVTDRGNKCKAFSHAIQIPVGAA